MEKHLAGRRLYTVAVVAIAVAIGSVLVATPVSSHVGGTVAHLWNDHIKPKADPRYANAVAGTDKAKDADKLDGIDSTGYVQGGGASVEGSAAIDLGNESTVTSIDGFGTITVAQWGPPGSFDLCRAVFTNQSGGTVFRNGITESNAVLASGVGNAEPVVADGGTFQLAGTGFRPRGAFGTWQISTPDLSRVLTLVVAVNYSDLPEPVTCNATVQGLFRE